MRTLVDIPEDDLELMKQLSEAGKISCEELVRQAISQYLEPRRKGHLRDAFGLWADRKEDGFAYQERLRSEWER